MKATHTATIFNKFQNTEHPVCEYHANLWKAPDIKIRKRSAADNDNLNPECQSCQYESGNGYTPSNVG